MTMLLHLVMSVAESSAHNDSLSIGTAVTGRWIG